VYTLSLSSFRCHDLFSHTLQKGITVFQGQNGTGKTSIVEGLSLFAPGRGLRNADLSDFQRHQSVHVPWSVTLSIESDWGPLSFETKLVKGRRKIAMNQDPLRAQDHITQWVKIVWPMNSMHNGLAQRRSSLNRLVFMVDTSYAKNLVMYDRALRERNRLLKHQETDGQWFDSLERTLAAEAQCIVRKRRAALHRLMQEMDYHTTPFAKPTLSVCGDVETLDDDDFVRHYCRRLAQTRGQDRVRGQTSFGVHKTRFLMVHPSGRDIALCSSGEGQSLLLSVALSTLRLSQRDDTDAHHFFLADEAMACLDQEKQEWLWQEMSGLNAYACVTGLPDLKVPAYVQKIHLGA
jgi:DNA replication and repair protein RecF